MSVNEDCELQELVKQTLEKSGSMSKIRAELRASVFLALEDNGCFQSLKSQNPDLQNFAKNADGILVICLIREFLDYFGLSFTASVFEPELASYGIHCDCQDRAQLVTQLNVPSERTNGKKGPLLCQMLQTIRNIQNNTNSSKSHSRKAEKNAFLQTCKSSDTSAEHYSLQTTSTNNNVETNVVFSQEVENTRTPFSRVTSENINFDSHKTASPSNVVPSRTAGEKSSDLSKNSLSSLGDLPPLTSQISSAKNSLSPLNKSSKQMSKLKAILKDTSSDTNDISNSSVISDDEQIYSSKENEDTSEIADSGSNDLLNRFLKE